MPSSQTDKLLVIMAPAAAMSRKPLAARIVTAFDRVDWNVGVVPLAVGMGQDPLPPLVPFAEGLR
jgi:hypothetical protein